MFTQTDAGREICQPSDILSITFLILTMGGFVQDNLDSGAESPMYL